MSAGVQVMRTHAAECGWHVDQYLWECDCGAADLRDYLWGPAPDWEELLARGAAAAARDDKVMRPLTRKPKKPEPEKLRSVKWQCRCGAWAWSHRACHNCGTAGPPR